MEDQFVKAPLDYHRFPTPGKLSVVPTKDMTTQGDLALAYSPGVAAACSAIKNNPVEASNLTSRANLVAVISNGTAVLGLGNIGPLASKPVMEGKACLFRKFAGIDVFDIEIDEADPDRLVDIIASLEPTFGGINLEDIKAPECFIIERKLRERMNIPVFHDDQHGTAIVAAAAVLNGLDIVGKQIDKVKLVCSGAGSAAIACLKLLVELGIPKHHIMVADTKGVVTTARLATLDKQKAAFARNTEARTLSDAIEGADIFLGVSMADVLKPEMLERMANRPLVLALANPDPEIRPELAKKVRPDAIVATGRSDYPNQVNNVLCFPFIFRGALDVGARAINEEMKLAAVRAIAELARAEQSDVVSAAYGIGTISFGPEFLIPRPFDPRLITTIAPAVAAAAVKSGVATRPLADIDAYRRSLQRYVYTSGTVMQPVFAAAVASSRKRVVYAEGGDDRVLRAAQVVVDEGLAIPILVGRATVIAEKIRGLGLRIRLGNDVEIANFDDEALVTRASAIYYEMRKRHGLTREVASVEMTRNGTLVGTIMLMEGQADGLICGTFGSYASHMRFIERTIGLRPDARGFAAMNLLQLPRHTLFICDTYVHLDPSVEEIADMTVLAAAEIERFGLKPRIAFVSHSSFGAAADRSAEKTRMALSLVSKTAPDVEVEGEMTADAALSSPILNRVFPGARLTAEANLLIMPNLDAANNTLNALKVVGGQGVSVGPILLGAARPAHILSETATVRGIVNMTALTTVAARSSLLRA
jgi:malate dehydrogenase (oxaloacetate-decarboxylating)(NADP+)